VNLLHFQRQVTQAIEFMNGLGFVKWVNLNVLSIKEIKKIGNHEKISI